MNDSAQNASNVSITVLSTGKLVTGEDYYAYIDIPAENFVSFKEAEQTGNFQPADYGTVLKWGYGKEPSESVAKEMQEKHQIDPDYEEKLLEETKKLLSEQLDRHLEEKLRGKIDQLKKNSD